MCLPLQSVNLYVPWNGHRLSYALSVPVINNTNMAIVGVYEVETTSALFFSGILKIRGKTSEKIM
jgi:hypothetical protein